MAYVKKKFGLRVNVWNGEDNQRKAIVKFGDEIAQLITKPYVSCKRMHDRLAFMQWDNKTENGIVLFSGNKLQFALAADCEKMMDFVGEYDVDVVNHNENGVVFVKLADRKPTKKALTEVEEKPTLTVASGVTATIDPSLILRAERKAGLAEMLEDAIAELQARYDALEQEHIAARELLNEIAGKQGNVYDQIKTYKAALEIARKGETK